MSAGVSEERREAVERQAQGGLERALMRAFWQAMQDQPMPVMAGLEAAARTLGALYRQAAAVHGPGGCDCGWRPEPDSDLIVLEAMLAAALLQPPGRTLAEMEPAGRA
ncbi:hypothetical protein [Methylobacterium organophilum]|uniref:Uncharacterized protein n=1 Tax=Methylobacterium organophilum TaxID=410 RepID=A0ABQ4TE68_METOR|nr:hypothetical protein [Methylobacterium organophilum]GJE29324.1 hypothetical protein LKMONMHP_4204 [Methylobacterium organophilum]